jgi:hypothetical protein
MNRRGLYTIFYVVFGSAFFVSAITGKNQAVSAVLEEAAEVAVCVL